MKPIKIILGILLSLFILGISYFTYNLFINPISPRESVEYKNEGKEINISYYRPYKKERLIFGEATDGALVPYGKYWRLGANLTTKVITNQDVEIAGRKLPKGTYGLYTYPYAENWVLVIHETTGRISFSEPDSKGIIMKINIPVQSIDKPLEQFTIDFVGSSIRMRWDRTKVIIPIN
jgi:hypothetical protein